MSTRRLSPEFLLAAQCCRWPPAPERDAAVRAAARAVDWARFLAVVRRQRVEGLASAALRRAEVQVPADTADALRRAATEIARTNLAFAAESRKLAGLFEQAGLRLLFVKGATLDMLAYGALGLKRGRDIDLVIAAADAASGCALLADAGYERIIPGPEIGPDRFESWVALCKETNWRHPESGIIVELHTGLVDNPALLPGIGAHSPDQIIEVAPGIRLRTLRTEELFAYLCVHGATHSWSRLKWIADVAALLARLDPAEIERLYRQSLRFGVGRCSAQALLLCRRLFQTALPAELLVELRSDRFAIWLAATALDTMTSRHGETELDATILGTLPIHLSHFALGRGWRYKTGELRRKLSNHEDQARLGLPRPLHFLYPIISVPSWLWRRVRGPASV